VRRVGTRGRTTTALRLSTERILITHVGSLPRSGEVVELLYKKDQVIAGVDCGFGSFAGYSRVDPAIVCKKLRTLADGAALATEELWQKRH
jgi:hypothetical protein